MTPTDKLADALRLIDQLSCALNECEKVSVVLCDCRDNSGNPYPSQWMADVRGKATAFLANHAASLAAPAYPINPPETDSKLIDAAPSEPVPSRECWNAAIVEALLAPKGLHDYAWVKQRAIELAREGK